MNSQITPKFFSGRVTNYGNGKISIKVAQRTAGPAKKLAALSLFALSLLLLSASSSLAVTTTSTASGGNWNAGSSWVGGVAPGSLDDAVIAPGATMTVTANATINSIVFASTSSSSMTLNVNTSVTLTVTNSVVVQNDNSDSITVSIGGLGAITCASFTVGGTTAPTSVSVVTLNSTISTLTISGDLTIDAQDPGIENDATFNLQSGSVTVGGTVSLIADDTGGGNGADATLTLASGAQSGTLFLSGATPFTESGTGLQRIFTASGTTATVNYSGATQVVRATTYTNLTLSGSATKTMAASFTVNTNVTIGLGVTLDIGNDNLTLSSATIVVNGTLDFTDANGSVTSGVATSILTMGASGLIRTLDGNGLGPANNASLIATAAFTTTSIDTVGTVEYNRTSDAAGIITDRNYNNLIISNANAKTWTRTATTRTVNGDLTIGTGGSFTLAVNFAVNIRGDWSNGGTFTTTTGTVVFNGTSAQAIGGANASAFAGLTINNTAGVTLNTSGSVSAILTLTTDLTIPDPAVLTQTGTSAGTGDAVGAVSRTNTDLTLRSFGNPFVQIAIGAGGSATVEVFLVKGQPVSGFAAAVLRTYTITGTAGTGAQVQLHWVDTELNGNADGGPTLHLWREVSGTWTDQGASAANSSVDNWVRNSGVNTFSSWTLASTPSAPTAVKLNRFQAVGYSDGVALAWDSGDEINNLGYHVYRDENGRRVRVTPSVVAGSALRVGVGMRLAAGFSYAWFDSKGSANTGYYLEAIDLNGTRQMFGPIYPMGGKGISPKRQRALMVGELNAAARENGGAISENSWAASLSKAGRSEILRVNADGIAKQHELAAGAAVKIAVSRSGWYRLTQPQLVAAGLDVSGDARFLQLYVDGVELPIRVNGNGIALSASDSIEFYGVALDIPSTDTRIYWLVSGDSHGKRIGGAKRSRTKGDVEFSQAGGTGSFLSTVEVKEKLSYFPNLLNGEAENIFGPLVTDEPSVQTLQVRDVDPQGGNAQLSVAMLGASQHAHAAEVQLNGVVLGTIAFTGQQNVVANFTVDRVILQQGANTLTFTATSGELDLLFVDWARLTYARQYRADNNALQFSLNGGRTARVTGFTTANVRVFDVTDPNNAAEVDSQVVSAGGGFSVMVQAKGSGARTLIALADNGIDTQATLSANEPSSWNAGTNGADMVILTHRDFRQAVEPLAALRRDQGLLVSVVDVEDVYDEFSYGAHSPLAVKAFLSWARSNWSRAPRFVLLVGDSSWDPRNYTDEGANDFVPTRMVDTAHMETASDDWLVDFNGDELADMAIGRLPTRTAAQAALMTGKIIAFEQALDQNAPTRGALMVADNGFEGQSAQTAALLPPGITVQSINRSVVGNDDTTRGQIMTALNEGPSVVNFYGHGSVTVWTGAGLLDNQLAGTLSNTNRLSLFVMMTCLNGYAHDAYTDTLGEAVLKAPNGGAVAVWASSGFTEPQPQFALDNEFYRQLFGTESLRLGEATRNAKAAVSDLDVRRTWILFGDPAMRIR